MYSEIGIRHSGRFIIFERLEDARKISRSRVILKPDAFAKEHYSLLKWQHYSSFCWLVLFLELHKNIHVPLQNRRYPNKSPVYEHIHGYRESSRDFNDFQEIYITARDDFQKQSSTL